MTDGTVDGCLLLLLLLPPHVVGRAKNCIEARYLGFFVH